MLTSYLLIVTSYIASHGINYFTSNINPLNLLGMYTCAKRSILTFYHHWAHNFMNPTSGIVYTLAWSLISFLKNFFFVPST